MVVNKVGRDIYNKFIRADRHKQWGLNSSERNASVRARMPTRTHRDCRYITDTYQPMPQHRCTRLFEAMLAHPGMTVMLAAGHREIVKLVPWMRMDYTEPVDAFFYQKYGQLSYRNLGFEPVNLPQEQFEPVSVVDYPNDHAYTRISEFKHITGQWLPSTLLGCEYPCATGNPYYAAPRLEDAEPYRRYEAEAENIPDVAFAGRLLRCCHNMDQVVGQSLATFKKLRQLYEAGSDQEMTSVAAPVAA